MTAAETITVLVVDDKLGFVSTMKDILAGENYKVVMATDAAEAALQFKNIQPDMVILDVNLPDGDGLTLTTQFKSGNQQKKWLPIILVSSDATIEDHLKGYHAGCDDYLTKPFDPRILLAKLTVISRILKIIKSV